MKKSVAAVTALSLALGSAATFLVLGCENGQDKADHDASAQVEQADLLRAKATVSDPAQLDKAQTIYDTLAKDTSLSPGMSILVRARQAELAFERANLMISDLREKEMAISAKINGLQQLAVTVESAEQNIDTLGKNDPASQVTQLTAQKNAMAGGAGLDTWTVPVPSSDNPSATQSAPTLSKLDVDIAALTDQINKNKAAADQLHQQSSDASDKAETLARQIEAEAGSQQVDDVAKAAQFRRDAADADAKAETLASQLGKLQASLNEAQSQKDVVQSGMTAIDQQIAALNDGWTGAQKGVGDKKDLIKNVISGSGTTYAVTINSAATDLAAMLQDAAALRQKIVLTLNDSINEYGTAAQMAGQERSALIPKLGAGSSADVDLPIWKQNLETLNPTYFNLQKAQVMERRAQTMANETLIDLNIAELLDGHTGPMPAAAKLYAVNNIPQSTGQITVQGLTKILDQGKTGVEMPKALGDLNKKSPDELEKMKKDVNDEFKSIVDLYDQRPPGVDIGTGTKDRANEAFMGSALANHDWAQFCLMIGDTDGASEHERDAAGDEAQVDPAFRQAASIPLQAVAPSAAPAAPGNNN